MLTADDIIAVEVTETMILEAVHYAEKSYHYTFNRMGSKNLYDRVRNIVKGLISESAFKHLLNVHNVRYNLLGSTHWTRKDRYDVGIDGHKYDVKGFFISEERKVNLIQKDPTWLLDCCALVPSDQLLAKSLKDSDYYVFPSLVGWCERQNGTDLFTLNRYRYLIHCFWDYAWFKNPNWSCLGKLKITAGVGSDVALRIGGQGENHELVEEEVFLKPGLSIKTKNEYFTLLFIQVDKYPEGDVIVHCLTNNKSERICPNDWGNIWVYDGIVYFLGYMTKGEFKRRAIEIPRYYKHCKQYDETKTVNRMLPIYDLEPLINLLPPNPVKFVHAGQVYTTQGIL